MKLTHLVPARNQGDLGFIVFRATARIRKLITGLHGKCAVAQLAAVAVFVRHGIGIQGLWLGCLCAVANGKEDDFVGLYYAQELQ